jgi:4-hydroxy-2-oxoheptanedioate aldolase
MTEQSGFSLARRLAAGETVFTGWCGLPSPIVAETVGREGFSAVTLDAQHGLWDLAGILAGIAAVRQAGAAPIVRVPVGEFATVSRVLDFGAEGVIAPMINTPADARAFAAAAKFPPIGERSWGPHRAMTLAGMSDMKAYLNTANDHVVTLAMIETPAALANLDAILATPGIDAVFVGPSDLSITLTQGAELDPHSAIVEQALDRLVAAAQKAGKIAGLYCVNAERALTCAKRGIRFLAVGSDLAFLRAGTGAQVKALKGA